MAWMPLLLNNLSNEIIDFKYHGIDIVESIINASKFKYSKKNNWKFSVIDVSKQELPKNYDLIFSRDALQHLPLNVAIDALKAYSLAVGSRYLLVGSYQKSVYNRDIAIGDYYDNNLTLPPFNLTDFVEVFDEKSKVNFDLKKKIIKFKRKQLKKKLIKIFHLTF